MKKPELLLPAGDLEKLKTACDFGADAVYAGGKEFSLRAAAGNLDDNDLQEGLQYAHGRAKKIYLAVNVVAHNRDIHRLPAYLEQAGLMGVDGFIISDPGVMRLASKYAPQVPITVSTQASVTNYESTAVYRDLNASRIVPSRELSIEELLEIKSRVDIELEVFVHGAMCVSYSGRCLLSHYMTGRSANQGACAQPCRYRYQLMEEKRPGQYYPIEEDERGTYILNSKDLCLLPYVPQLMEAGIDSFKVEGRMKSPLYVATVAGTYRQAIDRYYAAREPFTEGEIQGWMKELLGVSTRPFTNGFVEGESPSIQDIDKEETAARVDFCGVVKDYHMERQLLEIEQRTNFGPGENLEILCPGEPVQKLELDSLMDDAGNILDRARHPKQHVFAPFGRPIEKGAIIRRVD